MELVVYDKLFFPMAKVYILLFFFLWIYKMKLEYAYTPGLTHSRHQRNLSLSPLPFASTSAQLTLASLSCLSWDKQLLVGNVFKVYRHYLVDCIKFFSLQNTRQRKRVNKAQNSHVLPTQIQKQMLSIQLQLPYVQGRDQVGVYFSFSLSAYFLQKSSSLQRKSSPSSVLSEYYTVGL